MNEFLENSGYNQGMYDKRALGDYQITRESYQKRVDREMAWLGMWLCELNDKLFINLTINTVESNSGCSVSWTVSFTHQSPVNGEWCDLKIYNLPMEKLDSVNLKKHEATLRNMWIAFNKEN